MYMLAKGELNWQAERKPGILCLLQVHVPQFMLIKTALNTARPTIYYIEIFLFKRISFN